MKISDTVYNTLKFVAQYVLPALGTLYFALAGIWGLPFSEQVVGTILTVDVFLGAILQIVNLQYKVNLAKLAPVLVDTNSNWMGILLSQNAYSELMWIAQILLPGLGTLYFALSKIWGLPYGTEIVGTVAAIDTFLGVLLGISTNQFKAAAKLIKMAVNPYTETS
jgi:hypothetical protein